MKIGIVGAGRVGAACALSLVTRGSAREIVIVDRTRARAKAVAADLRYGAPLCAEVALRDGDYSELVGADLDAHLAALLGDMAAARSDDPRRVALRDEVICVCLPVVRRLAARFFGRIDSQHIRSFDG